MPLALALACLLLVAVGAAMQGAVMPAEGAPLFAVAAALAVAAARRLEGLDRPARWGAVLLLAVSLYQLVPVPGAVRAVVAPGQAERVDRVAVEHPGDPQAQTRAAAEADVLAVLGEPAPPFDLLAGATATAWRPGSVAPDRAAWGLTTFGGAILLYALGRVIGRDERGARAFAVGLLALGVLEAVLGLAWRSGPTTGLAPKVHYLGSATGTFVNRGHFAAFLVLALGAAWGLAAALFPLQPDAVRRHRERKTRSSQPPSVLEASGDRLPRLAVLGLLSGFLGVGLVAAQSRGPLLAFGLVGLAVGAWAWRARHERWHLGIGVGLPLAGVLLATVGYGLRGALGRFSGLLGTDDVSLTSRLRIWSEGLAAWTDAPVLGAGMGAWSMAWGPHAGAPRLDEPVHAHQELVEQLGEVGLLGTVGLLLLAWSWGRRVRAGFLVAPHEPRPAIGMGLAVAVGAVLVQSLADFPLHTPGVLIPTALAAGVASGALGAERPPAGRRGWIALAAVVLLSAGAAAVRDQAWSGPREQEVGVVPPAWYQVEEAPHDVAEALAQRDLARAYAFRSPLDPWGHAAHAIAEARLAVLAERGVEGVPGEPEAHAREVERAVARAESVGPRYPRLQVELARALALLADAGLFPDARAASATERLVAAVTLDSWRAAEAFAIADRLPPAAMRAIAATAPAEGAAAARVHYEHGRAQERAGRPEAAIDAWRRAVAADPGHGPAWFALGAALRVRGDPAAVDAFRAFLASRDRPGGMEGWALLFLDDLDAAEAKLRRVVQDSPRNRWAWEGLAESAARRADRRAEREAWERVLGLDPANPRARERIAAIEADERAGRPATPGTTLPAVLAPP